MNIAIITAFSERCLALVNRVLVSLKYPIAQSSKRNFHAFIYECNYKFKMKRSFTFQNKAVPIQTNYIKTTQIDSSKIEWKSPLADINVYQHFCDNYFQKFDYALFCHNDIIFYDSNLFDDAIGILNQLDPSYDIIAEVSSNAIDYLSMRFHPAFIFVSYKDFKNRNLSFCHKSEIGAKDCKWFPSELDGGSPLLSSYYNNANSHLKSIPYVHIPSHWFLHDRCSGPLGIELTKNIESPEFYIKIKEAEEYVSDNA